MLGWALIAWAGHVGIPLGDMAGEILRRYHMPDRLYPVIDDERADRGTAADALRNPARRADSGDANPQTRAGRCAAGGRLTVPLTLLAQLSSRNLWRYRRRNLTLFAAILVAVAGCLLTSALLRGYQHDMMDDAIANLSGNLNVTAPGYRADPSIARSFALDAAFAPDIPADEMIGWTRRVRVPAVVLSERETRGVSLVGVDPDDERAMSFLGSVGIQGDALVDPGRRPHPARRRTREAARYRGGPPRRRHHTRRRWTQSRSRVFASRGSTTRPERRSKKRMRSRACAPCRKCWGRMRSPKYRFACATIVSVPARTGRLRRRWAGSRC